MILSRHLSFLSNYRDQRLVTNPCQLPCSRKDFVLAPLSRYGYGLWQRLHSRIIAVDSLVRYGNVFQNG